MPLINKIRIVNFAYNKDNRIIPDTTLDFRSQDGLITLRNGGGKSIMAQIIMQPILPLCSLGHNAKKRTLDNIFRKDKEPSYVLIEWKLDNNAGYMTCGIALRRKGGNDEEEKENNIDYYTFILDKSTCDLNLTNLKLSTWDGSIINTKDYYEAKDYLESHGGKVYKSDSEFYKNNLMTYNIYPKEWKSIITKINGDEGGLLKLFENSVTSKDLAINWIIKTIKETLASSTNLNELGEQTENHIVKARRRIEDRKNRDILGKYTNTLNEFNGPVLKLGEIHEKIKSSKETMYNLKFTLSEHRKMQEIAIEDLNKELNTIETTLNELRIQSISKNYYKAEEEIDILIEEKNRVSSILLEKNSELEIKKKLLTSLKVSEIKKIYKEAEVELEASNAKIDKLSMEEKDIDRELNNLGYTINYIYKKEKDKYFKNLKEVENKIEIYSSELEVVKKSLEENKKINKTLESSVMEEKIRVKLLEESIEDILKKVEYTNIFLATNEDEIEKEIVTLNNKIDEINKDINNNKSAIDKVKSEKIQSEKNLESLKKELSDINYQDLLKRKELASFEETILSIKEKLGEFYIDFNLDNKGIAINELNKRIDELDFTINKSINEGNEKLKVLDRLSSGGIEINKQFITYLKEKSIPYILGADYIKESIPTEEGRRKAVEKNPLLPYAIILERRNIEYLKLDMPKDYYENLTIVIEREKLNNVQLSYFKGLVNLGEGITALALYDKELVIKTDLESEKIALKSAIDSIKEKILSWKQQLNFMNIVKSEVESCSYNNEFEVNLKKQIHDIEDELKKTTVIIENTKVRIEDLDELNRSFSAENLELGEKIRRFKESKTKFIELKLKVISKKDIYIELERNEKELRVKNEIILHEDSRTKELSSNLADFRLDKMRNENEIDKLEDKQSEFIGYVEGEIQGGDLENIFSRYVTLKKNSLSDDLSEYKTKAAKCKETIEISKERLNFFKEEEYEEIKYDFSLERKMQKERDQLDKETKELTSREAVMKNNIIAKERTMENIIGSLLPNKLKSKNEIENNLKEKETAVLKRKEVVILSVNTINEDIDNCTKVEERLMDNQWFNVKEFNLSEKQYIESYLKDKLSIYSEEIENLRSLFSKDKKCKEEIKNKFIDIKKEYKAINQTIDISLSTIDREIENDITHQLYNLVNKQVALIKITLNKLATDLEVLDEEQKHLINNYLDVAKQYTDELRKIDKNSVLAMEHTRRRMMTIDKLNYDEISSPRMLTLYLQDILNLLVNNEELENNTLGKAIIKELSVESLLEHYCDLNSVVIKFYKVEENISNSDYKKWEEMLPDNSGGEKFVSFFVLLATLINYSRGNHLKKDTSSMSIIMDNPFAAISSQHLLIPLFEYAKQNNIQLICFSDHDKVDIVDRFNTIIRLAITPLSNKKEIIETELISNKGTKYEEKIDEGYFNYSEQMSLL